jgi:hypothetical protein
MSDTRERVNEMIQYKLNAINNWGSRLTDRPASFPQFAIYICVVCSYILTHKKKKKTYQRALILIIISPLCII